MKVTWKSGTQHKVEATIAHEAIEAVRAKNDGAVTAEAVVKAAKVRRNPLHPEFEWDNDAAGHAYRLGQARELLRHFVVIREELSTDRPQRVYEIIKQPQDPERGKQRAKYAYRSTTDIMADPDMRAELLGRALRELISIRDRFRDLQELAVVLRAIDEVLETANA
jgi:hypothetical protein